MSPRLNARITVSAFVGTVLLILTGAMPNDDGRAGRTGSPGEGTCHGCHDDFALNSGGGSIVLSTENLFDWQYVPGTDYHLTCTVSRDGTGLFGMGLEALGEDNTNAGTLVITDATSTQIKTAIVQGAQRRNVVHTLNGGEGEGAKAFTFDWAAPDEDIGEVTFYFAGVAANGDGDDEVGDYVYTGSQVVSPSIADALSGSEVAPGGISVYPEPVVDVLHLSYRLASGGRVRAEVLDGAGRPVRRLLDAERDAGSHTEIIGGLASLPSGIYVLRTEMTGRTASRPIILHGPSE